MQGSVSLPCTVYILGVSTSKSWMLLTKYLVEGREEQDCTRSLELLA